MIPLRLGVGRIGPYVESANAKTKAGAYRLDRWAEAVSMAVRYYHRDPPIMKPAGINLCLDFFFEKPKSVKRAFPIVKPDIDKLARAVMDSLTGLVYEDDSQVVRLTISKHYCIRRPDPGVEISWKNLASQPSLLQR